MPLPRPCKKCGKRFKKITPYHYVCDDCMKLQYKQQAIKRVEIFKRKREYDI